VTDDKPIAEVVPKLLPCPFCGGNASAEEARPSPMIYVECQDCGATCDVQQEDDAAIAAWNRRASGCAPVAPPDLVRALVEALEDIVREQQSEAQAGTGEYQRGYDDCIAAHADIARAALARAKEAGV
jgi:Lar family restriction alleviation protein